MIRENDIGQIVQDIVYRWIGGGDESISDLLKGHFLFCPELADQVAESLSGDHIRFLHDDGSYHHYYIEYLNWKGHNYRYYLSYESMEKPDEYKGTMTSNYFGNYNLQVLFDDTFHILITIRPTIDDTDIKIRVTPADDNILLVWMWINKEYSSDLDPQELHRSRFDNDEEYKKYLSSERFQK